ncbi:MAG: carbohydrate-binding domain-containing protein [Clostridia bacterium]|nr:carbohydrate-binding domain-containing protein [Clostridia bacterium]
MKILKSAFVFIFIAVMLVSCTSVPTKTSDETTEAQEFSDAVSISLSDDEILVDGKNVTADTQQAVYSAKDIVYYEEGKDFTYGEGSESDAHSKAEADAHTVVHITAPGKYFLSGKLSSGQIAVDLGEDAEKNPDAVVTLILGGVDITCTVAPAVIFYNVYECSDTGEENATKDVNTENAGANVIIADGTVNNINGAYVAKIYKSVELNEDGTEVIDSKKLHKYDAAFYSRKTMNITGGDIGDGILNINAENEGLDSELHLTINGGNINIISGNDGINTNEDNVSVTTINGGALSIICDGSTGEGDGIDSNGWLVINGGTVTAEACSVSGDAGIDSDMGIYINGGNVIATGNMLDRISGGDGTFAVFSFNSRQNGGVSYSIKSSEGETVSEYTPSNAFTYLIIAGEKLIPGEYTLWQGSKQLAVSAENGMAGGFSPDARPEMPEGESFPQMPEGESFPQKPEGMIPPEMPEGEEPSSMPQNGDKPQRPDDFSGPGFRGPENQVGGEKSTVFSVNKGANYFSGVGLYENAE